MRPIFNVITKQHATMPCNIWGNRSLNEDLDAQAIADGWRYLIPAAGERQRVKTSAWTDDGIRYTETLILYADPEWDAILAARQADEAAAAAAPADIQLGKATLRTYADGSIELLSGPLVLPGTSNGAYEIFVDSATGLVLSTIDHASPRRTKADKDAAKSAIKAKIAAVKSAQSDKAKLDALLDLLGLK